MKNYEKLAESLQHKLDVTKQQLREKEARIARLEQGLKAAKNYMTNAYFIAMQYAPNSSWVYGFQENKNTVSKLLSETPQQSLAHIQAEAVEKFGKHLWQYEGTQHELTAEEYANQLRQQKG